MVTQEQILGILRHGLTFVGGVLIAKGLLSEGSMQELIGALMTAVGSIWSIFKNRV